MAQYDPVTNTYTLRVPDVVPFNMPESVGGAAVIGDDFGRVVNGNSANNRIELGAGGDLLRGGLGADTLIGGGAKTPITLTTSATASRRTRMTATSIPSRPPSASPWEPIWSG